ncbi:aminopeptidase [Halobacteriales archaeon QS_3_64_16]|nr:MAG: aminopeptidase [Halobacteriales archaeon QS_3_64_16]
MDGRVSEHAAVLVDWSARIEAGENVVCVASEGTHDLACAVARAVGERGANLVTLSGSAEIERAYLLGYSEYAGIDGEDDGGDFPESPAHELALYENADTVLLLGGGRNTAALADVPSATRQAASRARTGVREARMATDWVSTVHPTRALAQQAGASYEAYENFVYDAVLRDWEKLAEEMARVKEILDRGSEVRIEAEETDLTMAIESRQAVNSAASVAYDSHNLPSGEVFTAPADTEGEVLFDLPMTIRGQRVENARLVFEDGEMIDWDAAAGEEVLREVIETDAGARRLGELGIGMNRGITRLTDNILFDEKMARTIHLALGRAYNACLPDGKTGNDSAVHVDLITDMRGSSQLSVDGEVLQRNGYFEWEDEFEG